MPVLSIESAKLSLSQKRELVRELTNTAARIMDLNPNAFYVFINENDKDNIGVGGQLISDKGEK